MSSALIIGDGPGGLSAALYLAKNEIQTTVFGQNETPMHYAMLYNYLGIPEMTGTEFQEVARQQITGFGANLVETQVKTVTKNDDGFSVNEIGRVKLISDAGQIEEKASASDVLA